MDLKGPALAGKRGLAAVHDTWCAPADLHDPVRKFELRNPFSGEPYMPNTRPEAVPVVVGDKLAGNMCWPQAEVVDIPAVPEPIADLPASGDLTPVLQDLIAAGKIA